MSEADMLVLYCVPAQVSTAMGVTRRTGVDAEGESGDEGHAHKAENLDQRGDALLRSTLQPGADVLLEHLDDRLDEHQAAAEDEDFPCQRRDQRPRAHSARR